MESRVRLEERRFTDFWGTVDSRKPTISIAVYRLILLQVKPA
jgi:hypothetical protein